MDNVSNTDWPNLWQLNRSSSPHQSHRQPLFLNDWARNFEFEFCNNVENKCNRGRSCITHFVVLHAYRRSQILLTFNRHQVMYSVFSIVPCVEVSCKEFFFMQQHSKEQGQALVFDYPQQRFGFMLQFRVYSYNFFQLS